MTPDPLYQDAVGLTLEAGQGSTTTLRRGLRIGYGRAVQLIDAMESAGILEPAEGPQPRKLRKANP